MAGVPKIITESPPPLASSSQLAESSEDFPDVVSWINHILSGVSVASGDASLRAKDLGELDKRIVHLVGELDIACEETSTELERTIEDISRGIPRLTYDLHFMREGSLTLQGALGKVQSKSGPEVADETTEALERLHFLDTVQRNMTAARDVLREAESWSSLESEVTSLLSEQKYEKASERLSDASQSMAVFENTPEYDARRTLMVSLQNQLEAALSSALVAAITTGDVAVCRRYFSIFSNIQRESEFRTYYNGSRRGTIVETWQNAKLADCDTTPGSPLASPAQTMTAFLPTFYASFLAMLNNERVSVAAIFPDPQATLASLLTSTLSALQPSLPQRLTSLTHFYGAASLPALISVFKSTEEFAVATDKIMQKIGYSATPTHPGLGTEDSSESVESPRRSHTRRRSDRMSISRRMAPHRASSGGASGSAYPPQPTVLLAPEWEQALFEPFVEFQAEYGAWETRLLERGLQDVLHGETRTSDRARLLKERAVDVFSMAEESVGRCGAFTHGYGMLELVRALDGVFRAFVDASTSGIVSSHRNARGAPSAASLQDQADLADLDYSAADWADIQSSLHLLEAARALQDRLSAFESTLKTALLQVSTLFKMARNDPAGSYVAGTTRGEMELLAQSALNTAELHALLNSVDPDPAFQQAQGKNAPAYLTPDSPSPRPADLPWSTGLFIEARSGIADFARTCQESLQSTILSPLRAHLAAYPSSPLWSAAGDPRSARAGELSVPVFSRSPSDGMQRVAEGLLNLPRLFEVYAADDALAFSIDTLPCLDERVLRALRAHADASPDAGAAAGARSPHTRRGPSVSLKGAPAPQPEAPHALSPEAISSAWLSSLGLSLLGHLTGDILPRIATLTPSGSVQLASDLGYLSNIVQALNVECEPLEKWREAVDLEEGELRKRAADEKEEICLLMARMKGVL